MTAWACGCGTCVSRDPGDDPVAAARAVQVLRRDRAAQLQAPVGGAHPGVAARDFHACRETPYAALEHLLDHPDQRSVASRDDFHAQPIAVHHAAHLRRRQEHAVLETLDAQETVAGAIGAHGAFDESHPDLTRWPHGRSDPLLRLCRPALLWPRAAAGGCRRVVPSAISCAAARAPCRLRARRFDCRRGRVRPNFPLRALQLTAPGPVRTLRGLPHLPGWRNW